MTHQALRLLRQDLPIFISGGPRQVKTFWRMVVRNYPTDDGWSCSVEGAGATYGVYALKAIGEIADGFYDLVGIPLEVEMAGSLLACGLNAFLGTTREHAATCSCRLLHRSCGVQVLYLALY